MIAGLFSCKRHALVAGLLMAMASTGARGVASELPPAAELNIEFARDIQPILTEHCTQCHGADLQESNYRLDQRAVALDKGDLGPPPIIKGNSGESPLIHLVAGLDDDHVMPPADAGDRLTAAQVGLLRAWIDQGANWPDELAGEDLQRTSDHWSLQPVAKVAVPAVDHAGVVNPVDAFIIEKLLAAGLQPAPRADRATLIRRLLLDLHGIVPTPEQVAAFVADDSPTAYERLVDAALADTRYGERWGQHWLDVVRYADTDGFEVNTPRANAWPYRDWVIQAFNRDLPFDQFVFAQLAGDQIGQDPATGFLVAAPILLPGQVGKDEDSIRAARQDALDEIISATSTAFMGLTVGCARCHNHKFDPILQKDYYSLQAAFAGVEYGERPWYTDATRQIAEQLAQLEAQQAALQQRIQAGSPRVPVQPARNDEWFAPLAARYVRLTILQTTNLEPCLDELEIFSAGDAPVNVALATTGAKATASGTYPGSDIHRLEHVNDGQYGNSRSWISNEMGRGWIEIELPQATMIDHVVWGRDRKGEFADRLPTDYYLEVAAEPGGWQLVSAAGVRAPYQAGQSATSTEEKPLPLTAADQQLLLELRELSGQVATLRGQSPPPVFAGIFRTPGATHRLHRGDHKQPLEEVAADTVSVLGTLGLKTDAAEPDRRVALARWLASPENPLTARVMVNRVWQHHFGTGIVATPGDFGKMGASPSHPELLDWLATYLVEHGWSLKQLHRLIVLSGTYQQQAIVDNAEAANVDADRRLLWAYPARRLEAEAIHDSILAVSGALNRQAGGPGFQLFQPRVGLDLYKPKETLTTTEWRRMIYAHKVRMEGDGMFTEFDVPDCGQLCSARTLSTTPLQALNLFNGGFIVQQSGLFAARVQKEAGDQSDQQVRRAFELALGRLPDAEEQTACVELVTMHGLPTLCRVLLNTSEFVQLP